MRRIKLSYGVRRLPVVVGGALAIAVLAWPIGSTAQPRASDSPGVQQGGGDTGPSRGVAYATTTLECNGKDYTVSVEGGKCTIDKGVKASCSSDKDKASASCKNGCGGSEGSGGCVIYHHK
jgi:hypothetical protein